MPPREIVTTVRVAAFLMYVRLLRIVDRVGGCVRLFAVLIILSSFAFAQERGDFIVVAKPYHLEVLDRYKQQLSSEEKSALAENSPFRIINADETLGDGLTHCMKVELQRSAYYFVKDDSGGLAGERDAGVSKVYRNVSVLADTVMVVRPASLELLDASTRTKKPLTQGEQLERVFQSSRLTFVRGQSSGTYGWVALKGTKGKDWVIVTGARSGPSKSLQELAPEIQRKLNVVNTKLTKLYEVLNRKSGVHHTAPQWLLQSSDTAFHCVMQADSSAKFYTESTRWLAKEMELLVLGTRLGVASTPGRIEIR